MGKIKRYKNVIERFLSGESGQRFFNIAYSIGAAIVILGALFKILHLSGGDLLLSVGMGTEVLMFILTAFDRPPRESHIEDILPLLAGQTAAGQASGYTGETVLPAAAVNPAPAASGTTVIVGGGGGAGGVVTAGGSTISPEVAKELDRLGETAAQLNAAGEALLKSYGSLSVDPQSASQGAEGYVEQMQALNRNIAGLNTIYEIQLRSVSSQLDAIQSVNSGMSHMKEMYEQTAGCTEAYREEAMKLTRNMQQLNKVYEQMLNAMTVNMFANPAARQSENN
ncbi:MAG: gliding motility protein GldL [Muribaculaceae bacterium]|nr:gliding motility protein GldL [Muribaculaceae bacterium]